MRTANSLGNGAPNLKSINVECNLLETWLAERIALQRALAKRMVIIGVSLLALFASTPPLYLALCDAQKKEVAVTRTQAALEKEMAGWDAQRKEADPVVAGQQMLEKSADKVKLTIGWTADTMNLAPAKVVIESCRTEVLGGELTIRIRADAETSAVAQQYVESAGKDPRVASSLLASSHRNPLMGPKGVAFEFVRKVEVGS
jgi:hypothetical protein